jgi:hypothetical protein
MHAMCHRYTCIAPEVPFLKPIGHDRPEANSIYMYTYMRVCVRVCVCVCVCVNIYIYINIYTYIHTYVYRSATDSVMRAPMCC